MKAYDSVKLAVARSISHDEIARVHSDETYSDLDERAKSTVEQLRAYGLEDWCDMGSERRGGYVDAWGTHEGGEWRVYIVHAPV